jgi:hypothetical protein
MKNSNKVKNQSQNYEQVSQNDYSDDKSEIIVFQTNPTKKISVSCNRCDFHYVLCVLIIKVGR